MSAQPELRRPPELLRSINLVGDGVIRGVLLELPNETVRRFLPPGLELVAHAVTPRGTHPVLVFFQDMIGAHLTIPSLLPELTYHELIFGVPFTAPRGGSPEAFFYIPRLLLTSQLAALGGVLFWGFRKEVVHTTSTEGRYAVQDLDGTDVISLDFEATGEPGPLGCYPRFEGTRQMMSQTQIMSVPLGVGPWFAYSNFDKKWDDATLRPLSTSVHVQRAFVEGLPCGTFPSAGRAPGIDESPLGSFELRARFRQSLPYPG